MIDVIVFFGVFALVLICQTYRALKHKYFKEYHEMRFKEAFDENSITENRGGTRRESDRDNNESYRSGQR